MADLINKTMLKMLLQVRRDNVFTSTYKLEAGEPGFEISTNTLKIGQYKKDKDGNFTSDLMTWAELPIANKSTIDSLISNAISTNNGNYYTSSEIDNLEQSLENSIGEVEEALDNLRTDIGNLTNVMNFRGVVETFDEITNPVEGDVITFKSELKIQDGDTTTILAKAGSEWVYCKTAYDFSINGEPSATYDWVEIGTASASDAAIATLQNSINDINDSENGLLAQANSHAEEYTDAQLKAAATRVKAGTANTDIIVTPNTTTGEATIAHKTYSTGTYTKIPTSSVKSGDVYLFDSITTTNGHITGGTMKSLATILEGMTFIFDGGTCDDN